MKRFIQKNVTKKVDRVTFKAPYPIQFILTYIPVCIYLHLFKAIYYFVFYTFEFNLYTNNV